MTPAKTPKKCSIEWCIRPAKAKGLCGAHDKRKLRGQDMDKPLPRPRPHRSRKAAAPLEACRLAGCGRFKYRDSLCRPHYERKQTNPGNWSGPVTDYGNMVYAATFVVPPEHLDLIVAEAKRRGVKRAVIMREAVALWFAQNQPTTPKRYQWEPDDGLLGPEVPLDGLTDKERQAIEDNRIVAEFRDSVPLTALEERFGHRVYDVTREMRKSGPSSDNLPFGLPG